LISGLALVLGLAAFGCGGSGEAGGSAGAGGTGGAAAGGSTGTGGCQSAADCPSNAVCDSATKTCVVLACGAHADCGVGAYCSNGICAHNVPGGPCDTNENCGPNATCTDGFCACGGALYGAESVPPNVLIVLDRSSSMNEDIGGGTKWDIARDAINDLLASYGGGVYFGLMLYPGTDLSGNEGMSCGPGAVFVDPGAMTSGAIAMSLADAGTTSFGTPTAEALDILVDYSGLEDTTRSNYILLITDGQSTCEDPVPVVATLLGESPQVRTFVVGFGSGVDPNELNSLAQAGGTAQAQMPYYYQADDAASLGAAFGAIAGSVLSCDYVLSDVPPDPNQLYVYVDGQQVAVDGQDGWTYDAATNQITFHGATCDSLKAGTAKEVLISYGCPLTDPR
jgi:hypothetical protein